MLVTLVQGLDPAPLDGRWRWMLFDTDLGFAYEVEPEFNQLELITASGGEDWPNPDWSTFLFSSLLENTVIREHFIQRMASLLNTTFITSRVLEQIDYFEEMFAPEMPDHLLRWGLLGDMNQWRSNVETLRYYAEVRPDILREHVRAFFELPGQANVTVDAHPATGGHIRLAGKEISSETPGLERFSPLYPFTGLWFESVPLLIEAVPAPGYRFDHWQDDPSEGESSRWVFPGNDHVITAVFSEEPTNYDPLPHPLAWGPYAFEYWPVDARAKTYPAHMKFFQASSRDATLMEHDSTLPWPLPYNLNNRTRINGLDADGISFVNTSNIQEHPEAGYLGSAVLALDLRNIESANLSWTGGTVHANNRVYALRLQYRVGASGEFQDWLDSEGFAIEYVTNSEDGHNQAFDGVSFPEVLLGEPYVQIRWVYYWQSGDSGPRAQLRLGDIQIHGIPENVTAEMYFSRAGTAVEEGYFFDSIGWMGVQRFPWLHSQCFGWLKAVGTGGEQWLFYIPDLGWRYTEPGIVPYFYDFQSENWLKLDCP